MRNTTLNSARHPRHHLTTRNSLLVIVLVIFLMGCTKQGPTVGYEKFIDTTISVYGRYAVVKLPITKGVKIANPLQVGLGPQGILYASNQTGEVYSLRDTNGDGLEDM